MNFPNNEKEIDSQSENSVNERRLEEVPHRLKNDEQSEEKPSNSINNEKSMAHKEEISFPFYTEIDLTNNEQQINPNK